MFLLRIIVTGVNPLHRNRQCINAGVICLELQDVDSELMASSGEKADLGREVGGN